MRYSTKRAHSPHVNQMFDAMWYGMSKRERDERYLAEFPHLADPMHIGDRVVIACASSAFHGESGRVVSEREPISAEDESGCIGIIYGHMVRLSNGKEIGVDRSHLRRSGKSR